jgi:hypothetical protein
MRVLMPLFEVLKQSNQELSIVFTGLHKRETYTIIYNSSLKKYIIQDGIAEYLFNENELPTINHIILSTLDGDILDSIFIRNNTLDTQTLLYKLIIHQY